TAVLQPFQKDELDEALEKASMKDNKTVIIAVVNKAYVEGEVVPNMLDLFLEGFLAGENTRELVNHLMIVAVDQTAYDRCRYRGLHCYRLVTDGVDFMGEKIFMSKDFIKMMWSRTLFLTDILKKGYNFIFTDSGIHFVIDFGEEAFNFEFIKNDN
uniref:Nucleotide-diphospho-sugar transferase domain-containing protein n=1 Tax=Chenopodium quinoa TaxID=63459 RepID=A0A803NBG9_CHEQI